MRLRFGVLCIGCVALAACGKDAPVEPVANVPVVASSSPSAEFTAVASDGGGMYKMLEEGEGTEGTMLLFFGKSGDPFTKRTDKILRSLYGSGSVTMHTRYIDYDQSMSVRLQNEVITYDTLVLRVKGEILKSIVHPSQAELQSLLR